MLNRMVAILPNAVNGLQQAALRVEKAAQTVIKQTAAPLGEPSPSSDQASLEGAVVDLAVSEIGYKANAKLISVQRDMDRTLMDILV